MTPDVPFQQVPRAGSPAAEAEGRGEVGGSFGDKRTEWLREGFYDQQQKTAFGILLKDALTLAGTKQVKSVDIEMASIIEERLANMIR